MHVLSHYIIDKQIYQITKQVGKVSADQDKNFKDQTDTKIIKFQKSTADYGYSGEHR